MTSWPTSAASRSSTSNATCGTVWMRGWIGLPASKRIHSTPYGLDAKPETIEQIVESFVIRRLKGREVLIAPEETNHYLYLVLSGKLSVFLDSTLEEPVCSFGYGEPIGELSVIDKHATSAYVIAEEDSRLLVLDEAWIFLDTPLFAARLREWLKSVREKL